MTEILNHNVERPHPVSRRVATSIKRLAKESLSKPHQQFEHPLIVGKVDNGARPRVSNPSLKCRLICDPPLGRRSDKLTYAGAHEI